MSEANESDVKTPAKVKNQIREAAQALIEEQGYQNVQMQDIAHRAGIGRATLYRHYPAKDNIAAEIAAKWAGSFAPRFAATVSGQTDRHARITAILDGILDEAAANLHLLGAALNVLVTIPKLAASGLDAVIEALAVDGNQLSGSEDRFLLEVLSRQVLAELFMIHHDPGNADGAKQRLSRLSENLLH